MMIIKILAILVTMSIALPIYSLPGYSLTKSRIKRLKENTVMNKSLATDVPMDPDRYVYTVNGSINDHVVFADTVPLWDFDSSMKKSLVGSLPVGTNTTFSAIKLYRGTLYYGVSIPNINKQEGQESIGWIEGHYLKITGVNNTSSNSAAK